VSSGHPHHGATESPPAAQLRRTRDMVGRQLQRIPLYPSFTICPLGFRSGCPAPALVRFIPCSPRISAQPPRDAMDSCPKSARPLVHVRGPGAALTAPLVRDGQPRPGATSVDFVEKNHNRRGLRLLLCADLGRARAQRCREVGRRISDDETCRARQPLFPRLPARPARHTGGPRRCAHRARRR
jgi:hypothetical protein